MRVHGSVLLYVHKNNKAHYDGDPRTATSTSTQLCIGRVLYLKVSSHQGWWSLGSDRNRIPEAADKTWYISTKARALEDRLGDKEALIKYC